MSNLISDLLTYLEDYAEKFSTEGVDALKDAVQENFGISKKQLDELFTFASVHTKGCKSKILTKKDDYNAALFIEGFMMAMYMVGRAYDLDYV